MDTKDTLLFILKHLLMVEESNRKDQRRWEEKRWNAETTEEDKAQAKEMSDWYQAKAIEDTNIREVILKELAKVL